MCFSAEVSFAAAAVLIPAGVASMVRARKTQPQYIAIGALPLLFGLQQTADGAVWLAGAHSRPELVSAFSLAYMFFSWLAWPVWIPLATYFVEPIRRRPLYLLFIVAGSMLGAMQYFPYFAHQGWLVVQFLPHAIRYGGTEMFDVIIGRNATYTIYVVTVIGPLLLSSNRDVRIFGLLAALVLVITYLFFAYIYVSVFCFGGAVMSLYLVWMIFKGGVQDRPKEQSAASTQTAIQ